MNHTKMTFKVSIAALALTLAIAACDSNGPQPQPEATLEAIEPLPGGSFASDARAFVSGDGSVVVGWSQNSANNMEAFRWENGETTGLGYLPGGGLLSAAVGVSRDGSVVVGSASLQGNSAAFRWTESGGMQTLSGGLVGSAANDVSADGSVVVGVTPNAAGKPNAFRWTDDGGMQILGAFASGGDFSWARGVSDDGSVVVGVSESASGHKAFRWTASGGMVELGNRAETNQLFGAWGVSGDGAVVVGSEPSNSAMAFRWEGGAMESLGDLAGGSGNNSWAIGASGDGSVVVGHGGTASGDAAFIWTEADGMRSLMSVLDRTYHIDLTGWRLTQAYGVSDDGKVIVGMGTHNGVRKAWRAFLGAPVELNPQPEPPSTTAH